MTPEAFLREYEQRTNTHRFEEVAPLIADTAVLLTRFGSSQKMKSQLLTNSKWTGLR
jgi:hypothetical protein